jgi:ribosomal protein S18 acetylase RimI-like enzyme
VVTVRAADPSSDLDAVARLWLTYLTWGNDGLDARYGFRLPIERAVERDVASLAKFQPPDGALLVAVESGEVVGTASMQRIGPGTAEIKRMYVKPEHRGSGHGREMLDELIRTATAAGYDRIRLDSPDFMTAAHGLYRSRGFVAIDPYPESEIPDEYKSHWVFMELSL